MAEYTADQIIGKTLIAREPVRIYRTASDGATAVYTVSPGDPVGTVTSYLLPSGSRSSLFWTYQDSQGRAYYTAHRVGRYDVSSLQQQGALTLAQQQAELQEKNKTLQARIFDSVRFIALLGAGAYIIANYFKSRR